jgi:alkaline phosphatase D
MKLSRRGFLSATALLGASYAEKSSAFSQKIRDQRYAICQGATDATSTTLSVVVPDGQAYWVEVYDSNGNAAGRDSGVIHRRPHSRHGVLQVQITGLKPGESYTIEVHKHQSSYIERRKFKTLDPSRRRARLALVSCMNDHLHSARNWQSLERQQPDAIFFLGDAVYADHPGLFERRKADPKQLWTRFIEAWMKLDFYRWPELKPVFATWDDHDYGLNNSNRTYAHKEAAAENFRTFYGLLGES